MNNAADLGTGALIGDYLVEEARAEGGFAVVYRATHLPTGRAAAVKLLHRLLATSTKALRRFRREVELVDRLDHPNIVDCYGFGVHTDGRPYLAMEWLDGRTLSEELAHRGPFAPSDAARAIAELCAPLEASHGVGVVHRDVKASNVIAVPAGHWYRLTLVDFGVAKLLDPDLGDGAALTSAGVRIGSAHAMAPEQILGGDVDARTDIYALGVLLYQLLTGRLPFVAESEAELEDQHLDAQPAPPSAHAKIPAALDAIAMRCLHKAPDHRPASAAALRALLRSTT